MLLKQTCRFAALRDGIPGITDRMLSERLQELEQEGLVERTVVPETPVRVEYSLTKKGKGLAEAVDSLAAWAEKYIPLERPAQAAEKDARSPVRKSRYYRSMPFSAARYVARQLCCGWRRRRLKRSRRPVSPFPRDLSGTLAFQSDVRTASNPNGRVKIYTIDLVDAAAFPP